MNKEIAPLARFTFKKRTDYSFVTLTWTSTK